MLIPEDRIIGVDEEDTERLNKMTIAARELVASYSWCPPVKAIYFAGGVGGIVALYLAELEGKARGEDRLWVIVGDLPAGHDVVGPDDTFGSVLEAHLGKLEKWIFAMESGEAFGGHRGVELPEIVSYVGRLRYQIEFVRTKIIPSVPTTPLLGARAQS